VQRAHLVTGNGVCQRFTHSRVREVRFRSDHSTRPIA
jgi:hypothetical protein